MIYCYGSEVQGVSVWKTETAQTRVFTLSSSIPSQLLKHCAGTSASSNAILHVPFKIFCVITWPHILLGFLHVNMARTRLKYVYRTRCDFVYITHVIEKQQLLYFSQNKQKVHLHTHSLESHVQRWISDWIKLSSLIGQWRKIWGNCTVFELPSVLTSSRKDLLALASSKRNSLAEPLRQIWQRNVHLCVCVFFWAIDEWAI